MSAPADTLSPPDYAVIFTSEHRDAAADHEDTTARMRKLVADSPAFLA